MDKLVIARHYADLRRRRATLSDIACPAKMLCNRTTLGNCIGHQPSLPGEPSEPSKPSRPVGPASPLGPVGPSDPVGPEAQSQYHQLSISQIPV